MLPTISNVIADPFCAVCPGLPAGAKKCQRYRSFAAILSEGNSEQIVAVPMSRSLHSACHSVSLLIPA
ncbi:polysaccharide deacetylase, partial [Rhizobium ruizarguesonis]